MMSNTNPNFRMCPKGHVICPCKSVIPYITATFAFIIRLEARLDPDWSYRMGQLLCMFPEE